MAVAVALVMHDTDGLACTSNRPIALEFSITATSNPLDERRMRFIEEEVGALATTQTVVEPARPATTQCSLRLSFKLTEQVFDPDPDRNAQSYSLAGAGDTVLIEAPSSLGWLYAAYHILEEAGFLFVAPDDTVFPDTIEVPRLGPEPRHFSPAVRLRGFWSVGRPADRAFVRWMVRNRLNLVGMPVADPDLMKLLGISAWAGGHDVIPNLAGSDVEHEGRKLQDSRPNWYRQGKSNPSPKKTDAYDNPCLADPEFVSFLAGRLVDEIVDGEFKHADLINVWTSDQLHLNIPKHCARPADTTDDLGQFAYFYRELTIRTGKLLVQRAPARRVTIAGLAYNQTVDAELSKLSATTIGSNVNFAFLMYPIFRVQSQPLINAPAGSVNRLFDERTRKLLREGPAHRMLTGVVDYLNVSTNLSMASSGIDTLPSELAFYGQQRADLFAYMHPLTISWGPGDISNHLIAKLAFRGEPDGRIIHERFVKRAFGGAAEAVSQILSRYEAVARHRAEWLASGSSLALLLRLHTVWPESAVKSVGVMPTAKKFVGGGKLSPPALRVRPAIEFTYDLPPLRTSIEELTALEREVAQLQPSYPRVATRLATLAGWISHARVLLTALESHYNARAALESGARESFEKARGDFESAIAWLRANPKWSKTLTPMGDDGLLDRLITNAAPWREPPADKR